MEASRSSTCHHSDQDQNTPESFGKRGGGTNASNPHTSEHGGPAAKSDAKRLIFEVCCHPKSKLSQTNRKWSEGCEVLQFTKDFDLNEVDNQIRLAEYVNSIESDVKPWIWISLPCTGGTPWTYVSMRIPSAREKILKHFRDFDRLWISLKSFLRMPNCDAHIALEWPRKCRHWKLTKVSKLLIQYEMVTYHFDGRALEMKDQKGIPLKNLGLWLPIIL